MRFCDHPWFCAHSRTASDAPRSPALSSRLFSEREDDDVEDFDEVEVDDVAGDVWVCATGATTTGSGAGTVSGAST
ncbi:hypothetical protein ACFQRL_06950 [Microbacterium fluvii]|uniref:Uncharacterized protein n=1 Tax=Microbacterium fluvii TaxID=415215 RepID=A0ABW2HCB2_9MICO|nr:hypothetical protein [Microbacterium fluvii]MCU4672324.1 hypothetical protein [Microbacterium fluvii]